MSVIYVYCLGDFDETMGAAEPKDEGYQAPDEKDVPESASLGVTRKPAGSNQI